MTEFSHEPGGPALIRPLEVRGSFFGRYRASAGREMHKANIGGTALTYNQLAWLGQLFVKGVTTGTGHVAVNVAAVSVANPGVVTTVTAHGLTSGQSTTIAGTTTTPTINGVQVATVLTATTFSVAVNVSSGQAGAAGTSTQVSTSEKVYAFTPSSATDDVKAATFEWAYDTAPSGTQPGWRLPYVVGDELTVTWDKSNLEGIAWSAALHSPKAAAQMSAFTGSPATIVSTAMSPVGTQVFIDATTMGLTADNYVTSAELKLPHTWSDLDTLNLTTAAQDTFRASERAPTLTLTRYFINDNELDRYNDKAVRKIRVHTTGPALGSSTYEAVFDFYGVLDTDGHRFTEVDGLKMETLKYVNIYDSTAATDHALVVTTAESTIS